MTRSNTRYGFSITDMPGCASHHNVLQYTNFSDFGFHIMYNPHGTTHLAIGGVWNADWHKKLLLADYDMVQAPSWTLRTHSAALGGAACIEGFLSIFSK